MEKLLTILHTIPPEVPWLLSAALILLLIYGVGLYAHAIFMLEALSEPKDDYRISKLGHLMTHRTSNIIFGGLELMIDFITFDFDRLKPERRLLMEQEMADFERRKGKPRVGYTSPLLTHTLTIIKSKDHRRHSNTAPHRAHKK